MKRIIFSGLLLFAFQFVHAQQLPGFRGIKPKTTTRTATKPANQLSPEDSLKMKAFYEKQNSINKKMMNEIPGNRRRNQPQKGVGSTSAIVSHNKECEIV